jgi:myosin heavy subunit
MCGATINQFLLEKGRVVQPPTGERNYSIFYMLVEGCDHILRRSLGLNPGVTNYKILNYQPISSSLPSPSPTGPSQAEQATDVRNFRALVQSFAALGLESATTTIFEVLAAILHLGNILPPSFPSHPPPPPSSSPPFPAHLSISLSTTHLHSSHFLLRSLSMSLVPNGHF